MHRFRTYDKWILALGIKDHHKISICKFQTRLILLFNKTNLIVFAQCRRDPRAQAQQERFQQMDRRDRDLREMRDRDMRGDRDLRGGGDPRTAGNREMQQQQQQDRDLRAAPLDPRARRAAAASSASSSDPNAAAVSAASKAFSGLANMAGATDKEKANLIMQVLQLSDEQINQLPEAQRNSILVLKEQIAKTQGGAR